MVNMWKRNDSNRRKCGGVKMATMDLRQVRIKKGESTWIPISFVFIFSYWFSLKQTLANKSQFSSHRNNLIVSVLRKFLICFEGECVVVVFRVTEKTPAHMTLFVAHRNPRKFHIYESVTGMRARYRRSWMGHDKCSRIPAHSTYLPLPHEIMWWGVSYRASVMIHVRHEVVETLSKLCTRHSSIHPFLHSL